MAGKIDIPSKVLEDYLNDRKGGKKALADIRALSTQKNIPLINAFKELYKGHQQYEHILKQVQSKIDTMKKDDTGEARTLIDEKAKSIYHDPTIIPTTKQSKLEQKAKDNTATINSQKLANSSGLDIGAEFEEEDLKSDPLGGMFGNKTSQIDYSQQKTRYKILKELGRGGMGRILRAFDTDLEREVAIKEFLKEKISNLRREYLLRFKNEAQITAQLEHPGIPPVHEYLADELQFAMKFVKGEDLGKLITKTKKNIGEYKKKFPLTERIRIFLKACEAMAYAHSQGIIHRDLKPANIMIGQFGEVQVMDWGLAKKTGTKDLVSQSVRTGQNIKQPKDKNLTQEGTIIGTPMYMAPEQAEGEIDKMDHQTDIYSLGATLYEMLTLEQPIPGTTIENILSNVMLGKKKKMKNTPKELESIVKKAMALHKKKRYEQTQELADDIQKYLNGEKVKAHKYTFIDNAKRFVKKYSGKLIASATVMLALAIGGGVAIHQSGQKTKAQLGQAKAIATAKKKEAESERNKTKAAKAEAKVARTEKEKAELEVRAKDEKLEAIRTAREKRDESEKLTTEGYVFYERGVFDLARDLYDKAIEIDETNPFPYHNRGILLRDIVLASSKKNDLSEDNNMQQALEDLVKSVKLAEKDTAYRSTYAYQLELMGQNEEAEKQYLEACRQAIEEGGNYIAILNCGSHYSRQRKHEEAIKRYKQFLKKIPTDIRVYAIIAGQYAKLGQYTKAKENANTAIEKGFFGAYYELAEIEYYQKNWNKAIELFEKARPYRPDKSKAIDFALNEIKKWREKNK